MTNLRGLLDSLGRAPACLVTVESTQGSVPREAGAWMAVFADRVVGTIGGGHLELQAINEARLRLGRAHNNGAGADALAHVDANVIVDVGADADAHVIAQPDAASLRFALGPALGQCCGGVVYLRFEILSAAHATALAARLAPRLHAVALFGGGHVGHALARVLAPLPFALTWIDSRDGIFPAELPDGVVCEHSEPVQGAVPALAAGSRVLIMSFSHAEDLDVVAACLQRQRERGDLPFIGLIGSQTKWATFASRLRARGFAPHELAHVTCPIGIAGIHGKEPEVIAVAVAAQLLQTLTPSTIQSFNPQTKGKHGP